MEVQVVVVAVFSEQTGSLLRHLGPHGDEVEAGVVELAGLHRTKEVRYAQKRFVPLARELEAYELGSTAGVGPQDEVVPVGVGREVTPRYLWDKEVLRLRLVELGAQHCTDTLFEVRVALAAVTIGVYLLGAVAP